jgi:transcriptional regulator with XRE-family HTH domain
MGTSKAKPAFYVGQEYAQSGQSQGLKHVVEQHVGFGSVNSGRMATKFVEIDGEKLRAIRESLFLNQSQFSDKIGLSREWLSQAERAGRRSVYPRVLGEVADALGLKPEELLAPSQLKLATKDHNVDQYGEQRLLATVPVIEMAISATRWTDVSDNESMGQFLSSGQVRQGLFRVRVRGDCMKGIVDDGEMIELKLLVDPSTGRPDLSRLVRGKTYYIQGDLGATLKMFDRFDGTKLIFRAKNPKYKQAFECEGDDVQRLAIAIGKVELFD